MGFTLIDLYCLSIGLAAIIALVKYKRIYRGFYPFIYICWAAFINEIICYFLVYNGNYTYIPFGIYSIAESMLMAWFFREMGVFDRRPALFSLLMVLYPLAWSGEVIFLEAFSRNMTWFRLGYSFVVVILSIILLSRELAVQRTFLLKSPVFLICIGFILYYTCAVVAGVFELYDYGGSGVLRSRVQWIMIYDNLIVNLIYALAVICMPHRLRYSLPY